MPCIRNKTRGGCFPLPEQDAASKFRNKGASLRPPSSQALESCTNGASEPNPKKRCTRVAYDQKLMGAHPQPQARYGWSDPYHNVQEVRRILLAHVHELNPDGDHQLALNVMFDALCAATSNEILRFYFLESLSCAVPRLMPQSRSASVQIVLGVMARHRTCFEVQVDGCSCLLELIRSRDDVPDLKNCIDVLADSLESYAKDSEAFTLIVLDLLQRVKICHPNHNDWVDTSSVLLMAVAYHPTVSLIQRAGLSLIAWLSENEACRTRVIQSQGLELMPLIMQLHTHDSFVCVNAAAALCWIIHAGDSVTARPVFPRHHISVILSILSMHIDNASVFGNCVCVLCGLGELDNEAELLRTIRHGMKANICSAKVVESCLRWIRFRNVGRCSDELKRTIGVCLDGMRYHKEELHLQSQGCELLAHMVGFPVLQEELLRTGAVDVVLDVSKRHCKESRVQRATLLFLVHLLPINGESTPFGGNVSTLQTICYSLWQQ